MPFPPRPPYDWQLRTRTLPLGPRTLLMGILNVTPDSFSDGGRFNTLDQALHQAETLLSAGADLLDLGGESTRPDATAISSDEEQSRVLPILEAVLKAYPHAIVSVDTYQASTAQAALAAGAEIINDVSGLHWDPHMADVLADSKPGAILMHTRGTPRQWSTLPPLARGEILPLVLAGLTQTLAQAKIAGIPQANIVLDPGFGFGKRGSENLVLQAQLDQLQTLGYPILAGTSRKRFLTAALPNRTDQDREHATTASNVAAILAGAHILRIHDVAAARAAAQLADALIAVQSL